MVGARRALEMDDLGGELRLVRTVLAAAIVVSVFHYVDNTVRYSGYLNGQSTPIARWMIPASWVLLTAAGLVGYRCLSLGRRPIAAGLLGVYSASGLVGPLHYTAGPPSDFDAVQNVLILADTVLGIAMVVIAIRVARPNVATRPLAPKPRTGWGPSPPQL